MKRLTRDEAVAALNRGEVVALPTDTVYGLCAALRFPDAVRGLFAAKHRPASVALPVMISDRADVAALDVTLSARATKLADTFWPGPLTLVVPAPADLADAVGGDHAVGFRLPNDDVLRSVLAVTGPLAVTSANVHGQPPCTSADEVLSSFADEGVVGVLDGGVRNGVVSSVIDLTAPAWVIRREGAITRATFEQLLD